MELGGWDPMPTNQPLNRSISWVHRWLTVATDEMGRSLDGTADDAIAWNRSPLWGLHPNP